MNHKLLVVLAIVALTFCGAALAGWDGNVFTGTNAGEAAKGSDNAEVFYMLGGGDLVEAGGGNDVVRLGRGTDNGYEQGGSGTVWACGDSDKCGGHPGNDWLFSGSGGGQLNAGQYPAVRQYLVCGGGYETVFFDSADWFMVKNASGTYDKVSPSNSGCENRTNVSSKTATAETG